MAAIVVRDDHAGITTDMLMPTSRNIVRIHRFIALFTINPDKRDFLPPGMERSRISDENFAEDLAGRIKDAVFMPLNIRTGNLNDWRRSSAGGK